MSVGWEEMLGVGCRIDTQNYTSIPKHSRNEDLALGTTARITHTSLNSGISKQDDRKHTVRRKIQKSLTGAAAREKNQSGGQP
ncbi:hypothetical protein LEMLEM_LOCUS2944, partial [Lemmus lemmus]